MPRIIWKGAISFGLVHIPVVVHAASSDSGIGFDLVDRRTADPIGYKRINKTTGKGVDGDQIVRAYEYEKDHYVMLGDDEIKAANVESSQTVDIQGFVDAGELPLVYLDTPYYLVPDKRGAKVFALLRDALESSGRIGIATVVLHTRQHLAALIPAGRLMVLNTLRWADEIKGVEELEVAKEGARGAERDAPTAAEMKMAKKLIDEMSTEWDPARYRDTFRDDILALVERKVKAGKTHVIEAHEDGGETVRVSGKPLDLATLLKQSLRHRTGPERASAKAAKAAVASKKASAKKPTKKKPTKKPTRSRATHRASA